MAGSLRRSKKFRPRASIKKKKKGRLQGHRTKLPVELRQDTTDLSTKLDSVEVWGINDTVKDNYLQSGLVSNPNVGLGRNTSGQDTVQENAEPFLDDIDAGVDVDDDFKAALGQQRSTGPAPLSKLTTQQTLVVERLMCAHGTDIEAMVKDRKLNQLLLPASKLKKMIQAYNTFESKPGARCCFRVPRKGL
jgi:nucleolar protein 16